MSHQNRTVFVNMDQRRRLLDKHSFKCAAGADAAVSLAHLVHAALAEPDPVFDWDDGHASLLPAVLLVKPVHGCAPVVVIRSALAFVPAALRVLGAELDLGEHDGLAFVHVDLPKLRRRPGLANRCFLTPRNSQDRV